MSQMLYHRGPDAGAVWVDEPAGIGFGHRRLKIIDLSENGAQPMHSACNRYVLVFNGEIYNHQTIRAELEDHGLAPNWRGHSDTEILLAGFVAWGVAATLQRAVGMFALALWDKKERRLTLGRDRFGEKPLYYGWLGKGSKQTFVFSSELKALRAFPNFDNPVNRDALALYFRFCTVPAPYSIYHDIFKLEPGHVLILQNEGFNHKAIKVEPYWQLSEALDKGISSPIRDDNEAIELLDSVLRESIEKQSVADVPLGAFLSGGVDSSLITALMQDQSNRPIQTFTVGFDETAFDESPHALAVAKHLRTDHHELRVTSSDALNIIPSLPELYDEPFADSSQIPTYFICKAARQKVTVALSGDAGDELFGGYNRYFWGRRIWNKFAWLPSGPRRLLGRGILALSVDTWDAMNYILPSHYQVTNLGSKAYKMAYRLEQVENLDDLYRSLVMIWPEGQNIVKHSNKLPTLLDNTNIVENISEAEQRMMFWDSLTYLPDDILTKVDRAAMGVSLETRIPFLDHRVAELAWRMPLHMKLRDGKGKWALRQILYKHVPSDLIERPKAGFGIPLGQWLRGPLLDWAENLINKERLQSEGYLNSTLIRETWQQHLSNRYDWPHELWSVLMFQAWLDNVQ
ncbi:MAG: asparagine synthase (glutamine-hydrolyzing) [Pseudomonadota bacterium]|nr:asparagine synthase (glutamine-hydrolyzing) [Pseudomonadota bacterium]